MIAPRGIPEQFVFQIGWCERLGSPLCAHLLRRTLADFEAGGPARGLLESRAGALDWSLPLRLLGAVHRLVLEGRAPELARYYPSAGGTVELDGAAGAFLRVLRDHAPLIEPLLDRPVQTNDVGRSGSLLGGFLLIAERTRLPLRLLEIGASAGLNLCWDRYGYEWAGGGWGDPHAGVRLTDVFVEGAPPLPRVTVAARAGCDPHPLDVHAPETRLTLLSYTWPDQVERIQRLDAALAIARTVDYRVERASAAEWLERQLAEPEEGVARVVYHSLVWPYLTAEERQRVTAIVEAAGERATAAAPLAWLQLERGGEEAEVRLRIYPGFADRAVASTGFHAPAVRWRG